MTVFAVTTEICGKVATIEATSLILRFGLNMRVPASCLFSAKMLDFCVFH